MNGTTPEGATLARPSRRTYLEHKLFGLPAHSNSETAISYRDAADRASYLSTESEAADLLERAQRSKDDILARAVLEVAVARSWTEVVNRWTTDPKGSADLIELINLTR